VNAEANLRATAGGRQWSDRQGPGCFSPLCWLQCCWHRFSGFLPENGFFAEGQPLTEAEANETQDVQTPLGQKVVPASRFWNDSC